MHEFFVVLAVRPEDAMYDVCAQCDTYDDAIAWMNQFGTAFSHYVIEKRWRKAA